MTASTLSTSEITSIVDRLKSQRHRDLTKHMYHRIWKIFAQFYAKLDVKPECWSDRIVLFIGFLVENNLKSSTIRTYISGLKGVLADEDIQFDSNQFLLTLLTKACRLRNDRVIHRFPIYKDLLHILIDDIYQHFGDKQQISFQTLYTAMLMASYYGLLRAGEVAAGPHVLKARDVLVGTNKRKFLFILWTSKTHDLGLQSLK